MTTAELIGAIIGAVVSAATFTTFAVILYREATR